MSFSEKRGLDEITTTCWCKTKFRYTYRHGNGKGDAIPSASECPECKAANNPSEPRGSMHGTNIRQCWILHLWVYKRILEENGPCLHQQNTSHIFVPIRHGPNRLRSRLTWITAPRISEFSTSRWDSIRIGRMEGKQHGQPETTNLSRWICWE